MSDEEDDGELFRRSVGPVRPLSDDRVDARPPPPPAVPQRQAEDDAEVMALLRQAPLHVLDRGADTQFLRPGLQYAVLRKLRGGRYRIGAELDLHGLRAGEARAALAEFLREARGRGTRCVRIVHGKGRGSGRRGPVLKPLVTDYLARREDVLAFCTARPNDGGSGALYVLLAAPG